MTPDPAGDLPALFTNTPTADIIAGINQGRAAEALPALVLPPNYAQLPDDQKVIVLINLERTARGLSPFDSGNPQLSGNDPVLGYEATNHSALLQQSLLQQSLGLQAFDITNPDGGSVLHENSIEGDLGQRFSTLPGFQTGVNAWGEIIALVSPEYAVYGWMYQDAGSGWGHRHNILGIDAQHTGGGCFTSAGAGFAPPQAGSNGDNLYTVEFVRNNGTNSGYTPTVISADTPAPTGQTLVSFTATASSTQPGSTDVQVSATYDATVYGLPNDIRQVWIYPSATWGQPTTPATCPAGSTCPAILGQLPFGAGAINCPVTRSAASTPPSYSCAATVPTGSGPLVVIALDNYDNALYLDASATRTTTAAQAASWQLGPGAILDNTYEGGIDSPPPGATLSASSSVLIAGWFVDTTAQGWAGADAVQIWLGTMEGGRMIANASVAQNRPDVAAALGNPYWAASGFEAVISGSVIPSGAQMLSVYAHTGGKGWWYTQVNVTGGAP
jgi:hypothetical protein